MREALGDAGYHVIAAAGGEDGLRQVKARHPVAITLDVMLPRQDGWQVLHDLKRDSATCDIPVILLTIVDKKPLGFQLGSADDLVKPVDRDTVLAVLSRLAPTAGPTPAKVKHEKDFDR